MARQSLTGGWHTRQSVCIVPRCSAASGGPQLAPATNPRLRPDRAQSWRDLIEGMNNYLILIVACLVAFPVLAVAGSLVGYYLAAKLPESWGGEPK